MHTYKPLLITLCFFITACNSNTLEKSISYYGTVHIGQFQDKKDETNPSPADSEISDLCFSLSHNDEKVCFNNLKSRDTFKLVTNSSSLTLESITFNTTPKRTYTTKGNDAFDTKEFTHTVDNVYLGHISFIVDESSIEEAEKIQVITFCKQSKDWFKQASKSNPQFKEQDNIVDCLEYGTEYKSPDGNNTVTFLPTMRLVK